MALLLPPRAGGQLGRPALGLAGQRHGGPAHGDEVMLGLDRHVDVDPPRAARLGKPGQIVVGEHLSHDEGQLTHVVPGGLGRRVEIDPELVAVVEVGQLGLPGVPVDHPQVHAPHEVGFVAGHQHASGATAGESHRRRLQPIGRRVGDPLLEERRLGGPVHKALERGGPVAQMPECGFGHRQVVVDQVELRVPGLGKEHLAGVGHLDLTPGRL